MPSKELQVVEILGRTEQGMQEPFKCIATDGHLYYVKGRQTNRASLCHEWICGHLGKELGLPLPPFELLHVPQVLVDELPVGWKVLGEGMAFGSRQHSGCTWLDVAQLQYIPMDLQTKIFAFDWWIQNIDRNDGNPNLLWSASQRELVVIDHNLAFDPTLTPEAFRQNHIFRRCWERADLVTRSDLQGRFCRAMDTVFEDACQNIPPAWHWNNPECDIPANIDLNSIQATLARCQLPDFWRFS